MFEVIRMESYLVYAIIACAAVYLIRKLIYVMRGKEGCPCGGSSPCSACRTMRKKTEKTDDEENLPPCCRHD